MLDKTNERVTNDRLGLKVQLFAKDSEASLDILTRMQHEIITNIFPQILEEHDINLKGTIDLHELQSLVNSSINDREVREYLEAFSNLLELKNSTKVYYGPLLNLLPPMFKHARRVDKFKIIEIMDKRLISCDDEENGFVNSNLFKTILLQEIRIKEKIVEDFVVKLKQNPLDWNSNTPTQKCKMDVLVLTRKLLGCLKQWGLLDKREPIVN